jgi:DNA-binding CsgD family transcriptional regulator
MVEVENSVSEEAERLLGSVSRTPERPHYVESIFERKLRRSRARDCEWKLHVGVPSEATLYLRERDFERVVEDAGLTEKQRIVFLARTAGDTWEQIGRKHGHSKQGAAQIFRQAMKKVRAHLASNPLRGLASVYRDEVMRFAPTRIGRR